MANWNVLKAAVANIINANGNQEITGQLLQNVLNNIITNVGENATFAGISTLDTNPGTPDGPVFYLATTAGVYPNFNGLEVLDGEAIIFLWNNSAWTKKVTGFATQEKMQELEENTNEKLSQLGSKVGNFCLVGDDGNISIFNYKNTIGGRIYRVYLDNPNYDISGVPEGFIILNVGYIVNGEATYLYQPPTFRTLEKYYDVEIPSESVGAEIIVSIRATKGVEVCFRIEDVTEEIELRKDVDRVGLYENERINIPYYVGFVNSVDGSIGDNADNRYYRVNVKGLTKLRFKTSSYGTKAGYGFFMEDGSWQGVHTTEVKDVTINVPKNAVEFLFSWNYNNIKENPLYVWGEKKLTSDYEVKFRDYKNNIKLDIAPSIGLVSADNGVISYNESSRYVSADVRKLSVISFKTTAFAAKYGYGFFMEDGSWQGVHTTETKDVTINVPQNAVIFLLSWNYTILEENEIYINGNIDIDIEDVAYNENEEFKNVASPAFVKNAISKGVKYEDFIFDIPKIGAVSSDDGTIDEISNSRYYKVDVRGIRLLRFTAGAFAAKYGYGFFMEDGSWQGVHTTEKKEVTIEVPQNAKVFLLSWNYSNFQHNPLYISGYFNLTLDDVAYRESENYKRIASPQYVDEVKKEILEKMRVQTTDLYVFVEASNLGRFDYRTVGVNDYYDAFNELTYTYPNFKKKEKLGDSQTTSEHTESYPINSYQYIRSGYSPTKHIVLCGAIHGDSEGWTNNGGDSAQNILCQYFFLKEFLNNPDANEYYSYISKNYIIDCVPIINPWGVQNHSRYNARGVDLNRNFDINWETTDSSVKGLSPFSETESKAWREFIDSLGAGNISYICEVHSRGGIFLPQDNRWHSAIPTDLIGYVLPIAEEMVEKYGGTYSIAQQTEADAVPNQFAWAYYKKGIFCFEPELCQTLANDVSTRNGFYVNLQMTDYLKLLFAKIAYQLP